MPPVNVDKSEMRDIAKQSGQDVGPNASLFYSYIDNNHKISGQSDIYKGILNDTENSVNNLFLLNSNTTAKSNLIDTELFTDTTSNLLTFRERQFEILFEELIEEFDEVIDINIQELLRDLDLELFYKIEITETINKNEFNELLEQSDIFLKPNDLDNLFKSFDTDENDDIDYNELLIFIEYIKTLKRKREKEKSNSFKNNYSVTDIINIDTRFRNNYYGTLSTDFTYVLPETQSDVKKISIGSIEMPMTQYNVSSKLKNNSMLIISDSNNITINKDISSSWEFKSPIGCLSGDFLHGGFIFDDVKTSVSYDTSTVTIPGTIEASGTLYNNKWWDGSAVQTTNTWDSSITPIEIIEFNTKQPDDDKTEFVPSPPYTSNKLNYYSDLNHLDSQGQPEPLSGLGNINKNDFKNYYLNTRLIPFSYHLKNTSQTVNIENFSYDISNKNLLIADTYNALYLRPGDPRKPNISITEEERFIDINKSNPQIERVERVNYFPNTILDRVNFHYPRDSSGNIIWGWSAQTFDLSKAQVTTTLDSSNTPISSKTVLNKRFYNPAFKLWLDPSSLHILENYYTNTPFTGGDFTSDMSNSFIQNRFTSNNDVSFAHNEVTETSYTNISVSRYKKTTTINTVEVSNYNNLVHDILVEATPRITELSQNDISKSFINAIDGLFDDSYGHDDGMRKEVLEYPDALGYTPLNHKYKPLTKYTLYDNFSWDDHNHDISLQKNNIIELDQGNYAGVVETKHRINNYFPHGSANRTDICWNEIKYVDGESIDYPFDSSNNIETYKTTKIIEDLHVKSYQYKDLQTGEVLIVPTSFDPIKFAWLVTLPDGNYDETWKTSNNISSVEKLVNNSISIGIPGAIDMNGKFAAIIEPKWYNWLNNYNNNNNIANFNGRLFDRAPDKLSKIFSTNVIDIRDILFSIDRNTGKSIFASKTNIVNLDNTDYNLNSTIIKVDTFTQRIGHTSLRTFTPVDSDLIKNKSLSEYQDLPLSEPNGKITPEIALLLSKAKQPIIVKDLNYKNKKNITSVRFNIDEYGNLDLESNLQLKFGWVLGFRAGEYLLTDVKSNNILYDLNYNDVDGTTVNGTY